MESNDWLPKSAWGKWELSQLAKRPVLPATIASGSDWQSCVGGDAVLIGQEMVYAPGLRVSPATKPLGGGSNQFETKRQD